MKNCVFKWNSLWTPIFILLHNIYIYSYIYCLNTKTQNLNSIVY